MPGSNVEELKKMIAEDTATRDLKASKYHKDKANDPTASEKQQGYDLFDSVAAEILSGAKKAAPANMTDEEFQELNESIQTDMDKTAMPYHKGEPGIKEEISAIRDSMSKKETLQFIYEEENIQNEKNILKANRKKYNRFKYRKKEAQISIKEAYLKQQIEKAIREGKISRSYYEKLKEERAAKRYAKRETTISPEIIEADNRISKLFDTLEPASRVTDEEIDQIDENIIQEDTSEKEPIDYEVLYRNIDNNLYNIAKDETTISEEIIEADNRISKLYDIVEPASRVTDEEIDQIDENVIQEDTSEEEPIDYEVLYRNIDDKLYNIAKDETKRDENFITARASTMEKIDDKINPKPIDNKKEPIVTPSITFETINPKFNSRKDILETIEKIYTINERYERQISILPNNKFTKSLKRDMYREIRDNLNLLKDMQALDERYEKVLLNVEILKEYEDIKPEGLVSKMAINNKIRHHAREINRLCGRNYEHFPEELLAEINSKVSRVVKENEEVKVVSKRKIPKFINKKSIIGLGLTALFAVSALSTVHILKDKKDNTIVEPVKPSPTQNIVSENDKVIEDNNFTVNNIQFEYEPLDYSKEYEKTDALEIDDISLDYNPINEMMNIASQIASEGINENTINMINENNGKAYNAFVNMFSQAPEAEHDNYKTM